MIKGVPLSPVDGPILIVGLGNPGQKYRLTRHNSGFLIVEELAIKLKTKFDTLKFNSMIARASYRDREIFIQKPLTYMNLSGSAVKPAVVSLRIPLQNLLVVHDEIDLPLGRIKFKWDGGTAGHKGLNSIVASLNTSDFARLRIGIQSVPKKYINVRDFVLEPFTPEEMAIFQEVKSYAVEGILTYISEGLSEAMTEFNPLDLRTQIL